MFFSLDCILKSQLLQKRTDNIQSTSSTSPRNYLLSLKDELCEEKNIKFITIELTFSHAYSQAYLQEIVFWLNAVKHLQEILPSVSINV